MHLVAGDYQGSGVIIDKDKGLILTNAHVAAPSSTGLGIYTVTFADEQPENPDEIQVDVSTGRDQSAEPRFQAEVLAVDGYLDVAVIQIKHRLSGAKIDDNDLKGLTEVPLGSSDAVRTVDAIDFWGYPAASESPAPSFTAGVVSGPVPDPRLDNDRAVLNTDVKISPGNSGGPAVNADGHVVGVATWQTFDEEGSEAFSRIRPIDLAKPVIDAAKSGKTYTSPYTKAGPANADAELVLRPADPGSMNSIAEGCADGTFSVPAALQFQISGFPGGEHTDVAAAVYQEQGDGELVKIASARTAYETKIPKKGCITVTFGDKALPSGDAVVKLGVGGDLKIAYRAKITFP